MRHLTRPSAHFGPRRHRRSAAPLLAGPLLAAALLGSGTGCSLVVSDEVPAECAASADCPSTMYCAVDAGRCRTGTPGLDAEMGTRLDLGRADDGPDQALDAEPPRDLDLRDAEPVDADLPAPDLGPSPFGAEGDCFPGQRRGALLLGAAVTGVPGVFCTRQAFGYTQSGPDGVAIYAAHAQGTRIADRPLTTLPRGADPVFDGDDLLYVRPAVGESPASVRAVSLVDGAERPLVPPDLWPDRDQRQPFGVPGARGLVVQGPEGDADSRVVLVRQTAGGARRVDCAVQGQSQWGPVAGADFAAWFARTARTGRIELFLSLRADCQQAVAAPLPTPIDRETRLHAAGPFVVYLADDPVTGGRHRYVLDRRAPGQGVLDLDAGEAVRHAEAQTSGSWLATARYTPGGNRVEALQLDPERSLSLTPDPDMRNPSLSQTFLLWAAQAGGRWSLAFQVLEER